MRQVGDPRQLVGAAEDADDEAQCCVGQIVGIWTGRSIGPHRPQLLPQTPFSDKTGPHRQPAVRRLALIGKANPYRRYPSLVPKSSRTVWFATSNVASVV